jgi:hypothetical protein
VRRPPQRRSMEVIVRRLRRRRRLTAAEIRRQEAFWRTCQPAPRWVPGDCPGPHPSGPRVGSGAGREDHPGRAMRLTDTQIAAGVAAVRQYMARSRQQWTTEQWRTYNRLRKQRWRARQAEIARLLSTPSGTLRLLEALVEDEETA